MTPASTALQHDQEIELKLALAADQVEAFKRLMARRRVASTTQHLLTRYFDTPDFALGDLGLALRLRRVGRRWVQTLKSEGERHGGLSVRAEYETPVPRAALDLSRLPTAARALIPEPCIEQLAPVFETHFTRTAWLVRTRSGAQIEVALDVGEIRAGADSRPLCEIELELKSGRAEALLVWALALTKPISLLPLDISKAERGMQLARGLEAAPVRAGAIKLDPEMTVEDGFAAICRICLAQFQANLHGVLREDDPEYLHQARVALRRLRAALRLFRRVCPLASSELQQGLRDWNAALGPARDWDVLCLQTLPAIAPHFADAQAWAHFAAAAEIHRAGARQAMRAALTASNPGRVLLQFQLWIAQKTWRDAASADPGEDTACLQPLSAFAKHALRAGRRKVRNMARNFDALTPDARHELRIRVKRQRYAVEFFKSLHAGAQGKSYLNALVIAQDSLGRGNDAHVATRLLGTIGTADQFAAAFVLGWLSHATLQRDEPALERALKKLD